MWLVDALTWGWGVTLTISIAWLSVHGHRMEKKQRR